MQHLNDRLVNFASLLADNTREQAEKSSTMPFIYPHIALMPDAHLGKGATVGSVIPTLHSIIPAAVGVDIGCGMDAVLTNLTREHFEDPEKRRIVRDAIEASVPVSPGKYNQRLDDHSEKAVGKLSGMDGFMSADSVAGNWPMQVGSLGGGNHFIEVSHDEQDRVWVFLHSGSRGVGNKLAQRHIKIARQVMERYWIELPDPDLAYLVEGTQEFWNYIRDLRWAQEFARLNRWVMMQRVLDVLTYRMEPALGTADAISCHHNYTEQEHHFGKDLWVSRKGAISAKAGQLGLIPGSMGEKSYVVEGLGFAPSLNSAPHGAGRSFSRAEARRRFTMDDFAAAMPEGVEYRHEEAFLDEMPGAYKDIDVVMEDARMLVKPLHTLRQIINVKGA